MGDGRGRVARAVGRGIFGAMFILAGIGHLRSPDVFVKIMPPYIPHPGAMVLISGICEIALGSLLLIPMTSRLAAWGLVALLIAVFPANVYMYQHAERFPGPTALWLLRLPLQGLLIWWAYQYARAPARVDPVADDGPAG